MNDTAKPFTESIKPKFLGGERFQPPRPVTNFET